MSYDFSLFKKQTAEVEEWLEREFSAIRTGRATPMILDGVRVPLYGTKVALAHVSGITVEDAKTLRVVPWDKNMIKEIEKAIQKENLGLSVTVDDQGLRVIFPHLTEERRDALLKLTKTKLEEARVSLRRARDEVWSDIQGKEKKGIFAEDDKFRFKNEMEKIVEGTNQKLNAMAEKKEKEILEK